MDFKGSRDLRVSTKPPQSEQRSTSRVRASGSRIPLAATGASSQKRDFKGAATKHSFVPKTQESLPRRSQSCESLRKKLRFPSFGGSHDDLRTPRIGLPPRTGSTSCRVSPRTPGKTGIIQQQVKDKRPIHDKAYQSKCAKELVDFLQFYQCPVSITVRTLSTMSQKTFMGIVNHMLQIMGLDLPPGSQFVEELLKLLKTLNYPGTITKSYITGVGTQHVWSHVLAMLSWLQHLVEYVATEDEDVINKIDDSGNLSYYIQCYEKWLKMEQTDVLDAEFQRTLEERQGVNHERIEELEKLIQLEEEEIKELETTNGLKRLKEDHVTLIRDVQKMQQHVDDWDKFIENFKKDEEQKDKQQRELEEKVKEKKEEEQKLAEMIQNQTFSQSDMAELSEKIAAIELDKVNVLQEIHACEKVIWPIEQDISRLTRQVEEKLTQIHLARVTMQPSEKGEQMFLHVEELEMPSVKVPIEERVTRQKQEMEQQISSILQHTDTLKNKEAQVKENCKQLQINCTALEKKIEQIRDMQKQVETKSSVTVQQLEDEIKELKRDIKESDMKCQKEEEIRDQVNALQEELEQGKIELQNYMKKAYEEEMEEVQELKELVAMKEDFKKELTETTLKFLREVDREKQKEKEFEEFVKEYKKKNH